MKSFLYATVYLVTLAVTPLLSQETPHGWFLVADATVNGDTKPVYAPIPFKSSAECVAFASSQYGFDLATRTIAYFRETDPHATLKNLRCEDHSDEDDGA